MDGMTYHRSFRGTRIPGRYASIAFVAKTAGFILAMIGLTLLLHALGWTPPDIEQLGC